MKTVPAVGKVGASVTVLGPDLAGATRVTFNGSPATFTVLAPSAIAVHGRTLFPVPAAD